STSRRRSTASGGSSRRPRRRTAPRAGSGTSRSPAWPCCAWPRAVPTPPARLLPAHVEIMLAHEDLPEARRAGIELRALAEALDADVLRAAAAQAEGAIALADGGGRAALGAL